MASDTGGGPSGKGPCAFSYTWPRDSLVPKLGELSREGACILLPACLLGMPQSLFLE